MRMCTVAAALGASTSRHPNRIIARHALGPSPHEHTPSQSPRWQSTHAPPACTRTASWGPAAARAGSSVARFRAPAGRQSRGVPSCGGEGRRQPLAAQQLHRILVCVSAALQSARSSAQDRLKYEDSLKLNGQDGGEAGHSCQSQAIPTATTVCVCVCVLWWWWWVCG